MNRVNTICPRCGSDKLVAGKGKFKVGDALLWNYLSGSAVFGILAGGSSSNKLKVHCLSCRAELYPYEIITQSQTPIDSKTIDGLGDSICKYCKKFMVLGDTCIACGKKQISPPVKYKLSPVKYSWSAQLFASIVMLIIMALVLMLILYIKRQ